MRFSFEQYGILFFQYRTLKKQYADFVSDMEKSVENAVLPGISHSAEIGLIA